MKKTFHVIGLSLLMFSPLFKSCVSSEKFKISEARAEQLKKDNLTTQNQLNDCNVLLKTTNQEKESLLVENELVNGDLKTLTSESKMTIADQAKRLKKLQDMIQLQKDVMTKLKNSLGDALMNYKNDEINVRISNGKVYVSLEEKLLFKSGSDVVDPKGKEALKSLAQVLNNTKDITVMIEGHTDNVPIKTKIFEDNWDLSVARATSIVRILTKDNGFDEKRITASGRGKFHPINTNDTPAGRAANRRTEVILSPDLKELFNLLEQ